MTDQKRQCFVISPIGDDESSTRKEADLVLKHIIRPPIEASGYVVTRADQIEKSGFITNQIIECVLESDLVVADLTGRNPNVFYELALRHAARKPLIQIIKKGEELPFDVAAMRTISYDTDLEGAERARTSIAGFLSAQDVSVEVESPVSMAIDLYTNEDSDGSTSSQLTKLRNDVGRILAELQNANLGSTVHDTDDIASMISDVSDAIKAVSGLNTPQDELFLQALVDKPVNFSFFPDAIIIARVASFLAMDLPQLSSMLQNSIKSIDGIVAEGEILSVKDKLSNLLAELRKRGHSDRWRLFRTIGLSHDILERVSKDYIPF